MAKILKALFLQIVIIIVTPLATVAFYLYVVFLFFKYLVIGIGYIVCCKCLQPDIDSPAARNRRQSLQNIAIVMHDMSESEVSSSNSSAIQQ